MVNQNNQTVVKEIWVPCKHINLDSVIEEYPGYEVSNLGRVRSLNYRCTGKTKVRMPCAHVDSNGTYYQVQLWKDNKPYLRSVHRLVLSSFDSKDYFKGAVVDHIDSNPSNNRLSNLRWVTQQENSSTSHYKEAQSMAHINHPTKSKRVRVTFLEDGHSEIFPSKREVERALGIPQVVAPCIRLYKGYYKKLNVLFEYI